MVAVTPQRMKLFSATRFMEMAEDEANPYYVFVGDSTAPSVNNQVYDDHFSLSVDAYDGMLFAKRVENTDVLPMIRRIDYASNTVYAMYDDADPELLDKDFYVCVESGDFVHVFKCLDNANGVVSTVSPNFADVDPGDEVYRTSDGYQWKYMYTVEDTDVAKFSGSSGYIPVRANSQVTSYASHGAIDVIKVTGNGEGYDNHLTGVFSSSHIKVSGNAKVYSVVSNTTASSSNGFYTGCVLTITAGAGAGSYRKITDYYSSVSGRFVVIESAFTDEPTNNSEWDISPEVLVSGGGDETANCRARAVINTTGNTVHRVEILTRGAGYEAASAEVVANAVVGVTEVATVRPIYSPYGGHGYDVDLELGCTKAGLSVRFSNTEGGFIPIGGRFGQIGIMHNPSFANVQLHVNSEVGSFSALDEINKVYERLMVSTASVTIDANTLTVEANLDYRFVAGDWVTINDAVQNKWFLANVASVTNSSSMNLSHAAPWTSSNAHVFLTTLEANATIIQMIGANVMHVSDLSQPVSTGDTIMVRNGTGRAMVTETHLSGEARGFGTILQTVQLDGTASSGQIVLNEMVFQGSVDDPTAYGYVSAISANGGRLYVTRSYGTWDDDEVIQGANSGALFGITSVYPPEFTRGSGQVLYLETMDAVTRSNTQAETLSFLLSF